MNITCSDAADVVRNVCDCGSLVVTDIGWRWDRTHGDGVRNGSIIVQKKSADGFAVSDVYGRQHKRSSASFI